MPSTLTTYVAPFTGSLLAGGGSVAGGILAQQIANRLRDGASSAYDALTYQPPGTSWPPRYSRQSPVSEQIQPYREPQPQTPWREHPRSREFREEDRRNYESHRRYSESIQRIYNRAPPPTQLIMPPAMSCCCPSSGHTNKCSSRYRRKKTTKRMVMYRAPKPESHYVDTQSNNTWVSNNVSNVYLLNTVPQGASVQQRTGKRIHLTGLQIRGNVRANGVTSTVTDCSFVIVYDKRPTGAMPVITDIFTTSDPQGFMNDNNAGRFSILKRMDFVLTGNISSTANVQTNTVKSLDSYLNLKNRVTVFESAGTGGIGDIDQGALYFIPMSDATTVSANGAVGTLSFRLRYIDT